MPTYQYRCTECGHDLEAVQKFTDASLTECPSCGGPLRKIFNAVGVVFKGSGFYRNDSREANKVQAESGQESGSKDPGGKDSGGKDSGGKESGGKDSGGKESGGKESGASTPAKTETNGSTTSTPAKSDSSSGSGGGKLGPTASSTGSTSSSG